MGSVGTDIFERGGVYVLETAMTIYSKSYRDPDGSSVCLVSITTPVLLLDFDVVEHKNSTVFSLHVCAEDRVGWLDIVRTRVDGEFVFSPRVERIA